ncbi:hypothetical protein DICSQDRAFT_87461 [Dichomitus squalens LYAD-421 SS1]|uniref:PIN domain-containing protein n=2 Tax=Dichomitus squalens TaxID=114155 RepID=A0A4V2JZY9_9APHY|nr:uncharacterized protein DICSQDRAFT_87461 [Dichomitus squalens LYAD-421 SS1]EJF60936.1 hypothetical protein DICSQDRAFT_87461 [Dichomitus squalens LYAD-421 SS1]TBU26893.1 hypothetical protein BD311DRAFT_412746 [Dichomitus squalens]
MADATVVSSKLAMSKALGAAFLNHQVEQLEKTVHSGGNWRERRSPDNWRAGEAKKGFRGPKIIQRRGDESAEEKKRYTEGPKAEREYERRERRSEDGKGQKDADIVVVDASVLVHGLYHLKKWCREGREEIVIVPLEALNTLDLLKKGTSALAQRARAASRILEAQVGTNPRIRVQRDDAFVLWDEIPFDEQMAGVWSTAPEWVRRTICCARWESEHAAEELQDKAEKAPKPRVVLASVSPPAEAQLEAAIPAPVSISPVPLPAPQPNRYESRISGALAARWAAKAGVEVIELTSAPPHPHPGAGTANGPTEAPNKVRRSADGGGGRRSGEEERAKRTPAGRGRRNSRGGAPAGPRATPNAPASAATASTGLVERPQAVMTMMEMVTQPNRVVRVLARGEKLDP